MGTDHGRRADGDTPEERTIFYLAAGPSATSGPPTEDTFIVDLPVTALTHLSIAIDPAWELNGKVVGLKR